MSGTQQSEDLPVAEALRLLNEVRFGRVVFTRRALPAVRPVRHIVVDSGVVIAVDPDVMLGMEALASTGADGTIVAYEADELDTSGSGWSVVIVGRARPVTDEAEASIYRRLLSPLKDTDRLVAISADVVTGFRAAGPCRVTSIG